MNNQSKSDLDDEEIALGDLLDQEDDTPTTGDRNTNADDAKTALDGNKMIASNVADRMRMEDDDGEEIALGDCILDIDDTDDWPVTNMDVDKVAIAVTKPARFVKDPLRPGKGFKTIFVMPGPTKRGERNAKGREHGPHEAIDVITIAL